MNDTANKLVASLDEALATNPIETAAAADKKLAAHRNKLLGEREAIRARLSAAKTKFSELGGAENQKAIEDAQEELRKLDPLIEAAIKAWKDNAEFLRELRNPAPLPPLPPIPNWTPPKPDFFTSVSNIVNRVLARRPEKKGLDLTASAILEAAGGIAVVVTNQEFETLLDAEKNHQKLQEIRNNHSWLTAREAFNNYNRDVLQKSLLAGTHSETDAYSLQEFQNEFQAKADAARAEQVRIHSEILPVAQAVGKKFVDLANKMADDLEEGDRDTYARFGVEFTGPSAVVLTIRKVVALVQTRTKEIPDNNAAPSLLLPFLEL